MQWNWIFPFGEYDYYIVIWWETFAEHAYTYWCHEYFVFPMETSSIFQSLANWVCSSRHSPYIARYFMWSFQALKTSIAGKNWHRKVHLSFDVLWRWYLSFDWRKLWLHSAVNSFLEHSQNYVVEVCRESPFEWNFQYRKWFLREFVECKFNYTLSWKHLHFADEHYMIRDIFESTAHRLIKSKA